MAEGGQLPLEKDDILKRLDETLECSICIEQYKDPKVLNCQHSFCAQCLRQHVGDSDVIRCPLCNDESEVPLGGTDALKPNFFIKGLIEDVIGSKSDSCKEKPTCGSCVENKEAIAHCDDCDCDVCSDCVEIHKKLKIFMEHKVKPFPTEEELKVQSDAIIQQIAHDIDSEVSTMNYKICLLRITMAKIEQNKDINLNKLRDSHRELLQKIDENVEAMSTQINKNAAERLGGIPEQLLACEQQLKNYKLLRQQGCMIHNINIEQRIDRCHELMQQLSDFKKRSQKVLGKSEKIMENEFVAGETGKFESSLAKCLGYLKPQTSRYTIEEVKGDLFSCDKSVSLAHCVSADLHMGKGIAQYFKMKFMGIPDLRRQKKGPGEVAILKRGGRFIYYLITTIKYNEYPTYDTLQKCITEMRQHCLAQEVKTLCMPRIGCGFGSLAWHQVEALVSDIFKEADIHIIIYTL